MIDQDRFFKVGGYNPKVIRDGVLGTLRDRYFPQEVKKGLIDSLEKCLILLGNMPIVELIPLTEHLVYRLPTQEEWIARNIEEIHLIVVNDIQGLVSKSSQRFSRFYIGV